MVTDPGTNTQTIDTTTGTLGRSTCKDDAESSSDTSLTEEQRRCPNQDPNNDCMPGCGGAALKARDGVAPAITAGLVIDTCPASAQKSLQQCGASGSSGCQYPALQNLACQITNGMDQLARLAGLVKLMEEDVKPILRCEFVQDMFRSMYMPLCVDSVTGFGLVTTANGLGGVVMLLMVPFSVMATKRLDIDFQTGSGTAISQDLSYVGSAGGAF